MHFFLFFWQPFCKQLYEPSNYSAHQIVEMEMEMGMEMGMETGTGVGMGLRMEMGLKGNFESL